MTRPSKTMRAQIRAVPTAPALDAYTFTALEKRMIDACISNINQAQAALNAQFTGLVIGRGIDPDAVRVTLAPDANGNVNGFTVGPKDGAIVETPPLAEREADT